MSWSELAKGKMHSLSPLGAWAILLSIVLMHDSSRGQTRPVSASDHDLTRFEKVSDDGYRLTRIGAWAHGLSFGACLQGNHVYFGDGGYLEIAEIGAMEFTEVKGKVLLPEPLLDVAVEGGIAVVADGLSGIRLVDVKDPRHPLEVGALGTTGKSKGVFVKEHSAFVADGINGLRIIDIVDPSHPLEVGSFDTAGDANNVWVQGHLAFVADWREGLRILDVRDFESIVEVGFYDPGDFVADVIVQEDIAYLGFAFIGLKVLDVSDPSVPTLMGSTMAGGDHLALQDSTIFFINEDFGFKVIDVSVSESPAVLADFPLGRWAGYGAAARPGILVVASGGSGLRLFDVRNLTSPVELDDICFAGRTDVTVVDGSHAFVSGSSMNVRVLDVRQPAEPVEVGNLGGIYATDMVRDGDYLFVADDWAQELFIVNVSDPSRPVAVGSLSLDEDIKGLDYSDGHVYVVGETTGLHIVDVSDPAVPFIKAVFPLSGFAYAVDVEEGYAYVGDRAGALRILDVATPAAPAQCSRLNLGGQLYDVTFHGGFVYTVSGIAEGAMRIVDVRNPYGPVLAGTFFSSSNFTAVDVAGDFAYVADQSLGLRVVDVSIPDAPDLAGFYDSGSLGRDLDYFEGIVYLADVSDGLQIIAHAPKRPYCMVDILPHDQVIEIPATGGGFAFDLALKNNFPEAGVVGITGEVVMQDWSKTPIFSIQDMAIGPLDLLMRRNLRLDVPGGAAGGDYIFRVLVSDAAGKILAHDEVPFTKLAAKASGGTDGVWRLSGWESSPAQDPNSSSGTPLVGAYPNPFNPSTNIKFFLAESGIADLRVFNIAGRLVRTLLEGKALDAGEIEVVWDGADEEGRTVAGGVYFCRLVAGGEERTISVTLVK